VDDEQLSTNKAPLIFPTLLVVKSNVLDYNFFISSWYFCFSKPPPNNKQDAPLVFLYSLQVATFSR